MITDTLRKAEKQKSALRYRLAGKASENKSWYAACAALEYADAKHRGQLRKDGVTPYFAHPVEATLYVLTLPNLIRPVETVIAMLNHDVLEDTDTRYQEFADEFGLESADAVAAMSKKVDGVKKGVDDYWRGIQGPIATIGKPADRVNNQHTMGGVFTLEKQISMMDETVARIFPLMKLNRRKYPEQELAYENAKLMLGTQLSLHRAVLRAQNLISD
jgi:(p)ppGpp synthase/HD superfamily hydrolase